MANKFGLCAWTINLRTWIFGFTCLVFKTTYIDAEKPLREGAFSFTETALFLPLDKRNTRDKAKGLRITSERHIGELGVRYFSRIKAGRTRGNRLMRRCTACTRAQKKSWHPQMGANFSMIIRREGGGRYRL